MHRACDYEPSPPGRPPARPIHHCRQARYLRVLHEITDKTGWKKVYVW